MARSDPRHRTGYLVLAVTIVHVVLISMQVSTRRGVPVLEAVLFALFAEVQRGATSAVSSGDGFWADYVALRSVREENARLQAAARDLEVGLQKERALASQTRSLQRLLGLRDAVTLETVATTVIGGSASPEFRTVTIDRGTGDGVRQDMAVIAPAGVVGRVIMPSQRAAMVQLLIDRNAAAGVLIERSRAQGVVLGTGSHLRMEYVAASADIQSGDRVVTSGIDGIYPKGLLVGQIESVERESGALTAVTVSPAVDWTALEYALVVTTPVPPPEVEDMP